MKNIFYLLILILLSINFLTAQIKTDVKVEVGYLHYYFHTLKVDKGPGWRGYNLDEGQNGLEVNLIGSVNYKQRGYLGAGIGYLNFENIHGVSLFGNFEYWPINKKLAPGIIFKAGYDHIWNQYEGGRGTPMIEFNLGIPIKIRESLILYFQSGGRFTQQSFFWPVKAGIRF